MLNAGRHCAGRTRCSNRVDSESPVSTLGSHRPLQQARENRDDRSAKPAAPAIAWLWERAGRVKTPKRRSPAEGSLEAPKRSRRIERRSDVGRLFSRGLIAKIDVCRTNQSSSPVKSSISKSGPSPSFVSPAASVSPAEDSERSVPGTASPSRLAAGGRESNMATECSRVHCRE